MTTVNLLKKFRKLNVRLWVEEERLRYSAAKGVLTPELRAELSARKEEVLSFLRSVAVDKANAPSPLVRAGRDEPLPLSFAQQRLWFLDQFSPGSSTYNIPLAVRLDGALDLEALARSFAELVRRHESLRTTFRVVGEQPAQVVAPASEPALPLVDLSHLNLSERAAEVARLAGVEARQPFDLVTGPLLRLGVLRLAADEHVLLLTMHHIVSDGWSMGVLVGEVVALYDAYSRGQESPLAELPIQYADYAVWQREHLTGDVLERQLSYWREQLNGAATLDLPTDRPRPAERSYGGARVGVALGAELTRGLRELSRQEGATLFMTLLAGFQTLLARYTRQTDVSVGTPIANRNRAETEGLIGFFVNTLVMRTDLSSDSTFRELLRSVREITFAAYANQDVPFERLVEELQPARSPGHSPLFQVSFALHNAKAATPSAASGGLRVSGAGRGELQTTKFDLTLTLVEKEDDDLTASFEYSTELFEAETIERMAGHFARLLGAAVADPERRVSELEMLGAGERRRLLHEFNETGRDYGRGACLHELFEQQAARTPDACAVVFEEQQLTFAELDARANQLARYLRRLGVSNDSIVAICLERSVEMVVGLLGILKAGAAYLPLDPSHPKDRLAFAVADARSRVVLTQERLRRDLPPVPGARVLCLDSDGQSTVAAESAESPHVAVAPDNLAYVIYTSGSTGTPKGVMVAHRAITNHMRWMQERLPLSEIDCVLQKTPFTFDASVWEFFLPLMSGARMVLARPGGHQDGAYLSETIDGRGVTILQMVPTMLRVLLEEAAGAARCRSLRRVCSGGEPLTADLRERFHEQLDAELYNLYGPTEAAVDATYWHSDPSVNELSVPIGRPVSNMQVFILDARSQPVPVGVSGELYLGGEGLARGYLNRPGLTAERFIPDPFAASPGARLYRTGDLARYRNDGRIEFAGRADHQVKLRGFRIEVGEIESVLSSHAAVSEAVVMVREDVPGDRRLAAYVVGEEGAAVATPAELRTHLRGQLPEYMIPSAFVTLARMPLTTSGKIDRRALPAPEKLSDDAAHTFVAPRDALELKLAQLWGDVFGTPPVGVRDDFFELGGHSMLAVRLFALIEKRFGRRVPMAMLFERTTVEQLADLLRQEADAGEWSSLVEIQKGAAAAPFFCVHPVGGNVFSYFELARHLGTERPFYAFQSRATVNTLVAPESVEEMAAEYVGALRAVQPAGPYFLGGWSFGGVAAFEMARQLRAAGEQVAFLGLIDSFAPAFAEDARALNSDQKSNGDSDHDATLDATLDANQDPDRASDAHDELDRLAHFARDLGLPSHGFAEARIVLADATTEQRLAYLVERAREAGLVPPYMNQEQVAALYRAFKTNVGALRKYRPQAGSQRITLLASEHSAASFGEATLGWHALSTEEVEVSNIPGTHYSMVKRPAVAVLADRLRECLSKAGAMAAARA